MLMPNTPGRYHFQVYKSLTAVVDPWYWRLVAPNGKTVADSAEGYSSKWNARRAVLGLKTKVDIHS
jgi:uncharacterized protein YegP (UPF0339 family)